MLALIVYYLAISQYLTTTSLYSSLGKNKEMPGDPVSEEGTRDVLMI